MGLSDLLAATRRGLGAGVTERRLLGGSPERLLDRYALASPAARLPLGVSQLLVHGDRNDTVPATMARSNHEAATAAGDRVELSVNSGGRFERVDSSSRARAAVVALG